MRYRSVLIGALIAGLAMTSCGAKDKVEEKVKERVAGDPVPGGMATLATTATAAGVTAVTNAVSQAAVASAKPSLKAASPGVVVGVFPEQNPVNCAGGGNMSFSGTAPGTFTATFSGCKDGPYTVNATAEINVPSVQICTEDIPEGFSDHEVPSSLTATVNGTVNVGGLIVTLTNFGVAMTSPTYNGLPDRPAEGGTCSLLTANVHATGQLSQETAGETTTINLGSSSLDVDFVDQDTQVQLRVDGDLTVDTLCTDGAFSLSIATIEPLVVPDGDTTPTSGILSANGATVDYSSDPRPSAIPCSGLL